MSGIKVVSIDDAKQQLAKRSEVLNQAFDFAIRVTTIEGYCDDRT